MAAPWTLSSGSNSSTDRIKLICFPFAGGAASTYCDWPKLLAGRASVYPVELPGHGTRVRESPVHDLSVLLPDLQQGLNHLLAGNYALFGHSLGGLLCYELVCRLQSQGRQLPQVLFISAHRAPHRPSPRLPIHDLPDAEFIEQIKTFSGTPPELFSNQELVDLFLPILRADFHLGEQQSQHPSLVLDCPLTVFGGESDGEVTEQDLRAWEKYTTRAFKLQMFSGNHFFLNSAQESLVAAVAADVT